MADEKPEYTKERVAAVMGPEWMTTREICLRLVAEPTKRDIDNVSRLLRKMCRHGLAECRQSTRHVHPLKEWRLSVADDDSKNSLESESETTGNDGGAEGSP